MRSTREAAAWIPPFLVGAAAAVAAELGIGLLLYSGEGLLRALTVILVTQTGALGLGLRGGWRPKGRGDPVEWVRGGWLFTLIAFTAAAVFAAAWAGFDGFQGASLAQGLGLGILAGLPLYSVGSLLARMSSLELRTEGEVGTRIGSWACLGAAGGFLATGFVLIPRFDPSSIFLVCLLGLSGGALLHGWIQDGRKVTRVVAASWSPAGEVRIEERTYPETGSSSRVVLERDRIRGGEDSDGRPVRAWERALLSRVGEELLPADRVLLAGSGLTVFIRSRGDHGDLRAVVLEENPVVSRLVEEHLSGIVEGWERLHGDLEALLDSLAGSFDLVVADAGSLMGGRGPKGLARRWKRLVRFLAPGGTAVLGGLSLGARPGEVTDELLDLVDSFSPSGSLYRWRGGEEGDVAPLEEGGDGSFLLVRGVGAGPPPSRISGFEIRAPSVRAAGEVGSGGGEERD